MEKKSVLYQSYLPSIWTKTGNRSEGLFVILSRQEYLNAGIIRNSFTI